jgi:hypothetical protein
MINEFSKSGKTITQQFAASLETGNGITQLFAAPLETGNG